MDIQFAVTIEPGQITRYHATSPDYPGFVGTSITGPNAMEQAVEDLINKIRTGSQSNQNR